MPALKIIYISISIKPVALLFFVILCVSQVACIINLLLRLILSSNKEENNFLSDIFLKRIKNLIFVFFFFFDGNLNYNGYQSIKFVIKSNYFRGGY